MAHSADSQSESYLDIHRLIVMLLVLAYGILSLTPPRLQAPAEPYAEAVDEIARKIISNTRTPEMQTPDRRSHIVCELPESGSIFEWSPVWSSDGNYIFCE